MSIKTMRGKIARKVEDKGFGFIKSEDEESDYFFHMTSCVNADFEALHIGDEVEFTPSISSKGLRADNIRLLE